jgi:two-component system, LytTR family, sensor histidine kinase AlgZ
MHPILSDRGALVLYLFVFLLIGLILAALLKVTGDVQWGAAILFSTPMALLYGLMCLSSWYVCRSFPLKSTGPVQIVSIFLVASVISSALWILIGEIFASLLISFSFASSLSNRTSTQTLLLGGAGIGLYLLSVAIHYLVITFEQSKDTERRTLELKILAQSAELRALRAQINPHFLFNSLNSISALTTKDPPAARSMTLLLADFLRQTLTFGTDDLIPLHEEVSLCRKFIDIEQVRFGSRLQFEQKVADRAKNCLIPPLLLQPLIENAVVHGIAHLIQGGSITLDVDAYADRLRIHIENPCDPERPRVKRGGVGLDNVRKRLQTISDTDARLDVKEHNSTFAADISLPILRK